MFVCVRPSCLLDWHFRVDSSIFIFIFSPLSPIVLSFSLLVCMFSSQEEGPVSPVWAGNVIIRWPIFLYLILLSPTFQEKFLSICLSRFPRTCPPTMSIWWHSNFWCLCVLIPIENVEIDVVFACVCVCVFVLICDDLPSFDCPNVEALFFSSFNWFSINLMWTQQSRDFSVRTLLSSLSSSFGSLRKFRSLLRTRTGATLT